MSQENVIIGADYCPYCTKVKGYFNNKKIPYRYVDTETPEGAKIRAQQSAKHNWKTIPLVFVGGKFIGGCDDFFKALKANQINFAKL